jgi:hypothetical protein
MVDQMASEARRQLQINSTISPERGDHRGQHPAEGHGRSRAWGEG